MYIFCKIYATSKGQWAADTMVCDKDPFTGN